MDYQDQFRKDFTRTTLKVASANWFKVSVAYLILHIIAVGIFVLILSTILDDFVPLSSLKINIGLLKTRSIPLDMSLFSSIEQLVFISAISTIASLLMISWYSNFVFAAIQLKGDNVRSGFGKVFKKSFNSGVFKILLIIIIYLAFSFLILIAGFYVVKISMWLIILVLMVYIFLGFKSVLVMPANVLGKKSFAKSFGFSFSNITIFRMLKILFVSIILLAALFLILSLVQFVPEIGPTKTWVIIIVLIGQAIVQALVFGYFSSLFITALAGLFYRYQVTEESNGDTTEDEGQEYKKGDDDESYDMNKNLFA